MNQARKAGLNEPALPVAMSAPKTQVGQSSDKPATGKKAHPTP